MAASPDEPGFQGTSRFQRGQDVKRVDRFAAMLAPGF
jgi:hypothetical protein